MCTLLEKFKENCIKARMTSYNYREGKYTHTDSDKLAIDTLLKLMMTPAIEKNHPLFSNITKEYNTGVVPYQKFEIALDYSGNPDVSFFNGTPVWTRKDNNQFVGAITPEYARRLSYEEGIRYPGFIGSTKNDNLYNPTTHTMLYRGHSNFKKVGIISMSSTAKGDKDASRQHYICTPLNFIYNNKQSQEYVSLQGDSFIGPMCRVPNDKSTKVAPYWVNSSKWPYKETEIEQNGQTVVKQGYTLADYYVVIDIDNGCQIEKIKETFSNMPDYLSPQIIIQERGYKGTKAGNASALIFFDDPLTADERKIILDKIRWYMLYEANVFAIDSKCTGVNLFKNPVKQIDGQTQRCTAIHDNLAPRKLSSALNMLTLGVNHDHSNEKEVEEWIIKNHYKYSNYSYSQLVEMYNNSDNPPEDANKSDILDESEVIPEGFRNDTAIKELSVMLLQEYNRIGFEAAFNDSNLLDRVCTAVFPIMLETYDNNDGQITYNWVKSRLKWCYERDMKVFRSENDDIRTELLVNASKQRMFMLVFHQHQLMDAYGLPCLKESDLAEMPELKSIYKNKCTYSHEECQHGADTNKLKAIAWAFASCKEDIGEVVKKVKSMYRFSEMNEATLRSIYSSFVKLLNEYKDDQFTASRIREVSQYLTTYIELCTVWSRNRKDREKISSIKVIRRLRSDQFKLDVSGHLLNEKNDLIRCIKRTIEQLMYFRVNSRIKINSYKDVCRKNGINQLFAFIYSEFKFDWSSCASMLTYVHDKFRGSELNNTNMEHIRFADLYSDWSAQLLETTKNITLSQMIKIAYGRDKAYELLREAYVEIEDIHNEEQLVDYLNNRTGVFAMCSESFDKMMNSFIDIYKDDPHFHHTLTKMYEKFKVYLTIKFRKDNLGDELITFKTASQKLKSLKNLMTEHADKIINRNRVHIAQCYAL